MTKATKKDSEWFLLDDGTEVYIGDEQDGFIDEYTDDEVDEWLEAWKYNNDVII